MQELIFNLKAGQLPTTSGKYICELGSETLILYYDADDNTWHGKAPTCNITSNKVYTSTYTIPDMCADVKLSRLYMLQNSHNRLTTLREEAFQSAKEEGKETGLKSALVLRAVNQIDVPSKEEVILMLKLADDIHRLWLDKEAGYPHRSESETVAEFETRLQDWQYNKFVRQWNERKTL